MLLSIVAAFCDNDVQFVPNFLKSINECVKCPHEIILIDNRENNNDDIDFKDAKVYVKGYNAYQFEARRYSVQFCSGDYIWFMDIDDNALDISEDLIDKVSGDTVCFQYAIKLSVIKMPYTHEYTSKIPYKNNSYFCTPERITSIMDCRVWDICCCTLWNKWIKRDLLLNIIKDIPKDKVIVASEDILYSALAINRSKQIEFRSEFIYLYYECRSKGNSDNFSKERFMHIIKGQKDSLNLFNTLLPGHTEYAEVITFVAYFYTKLILTDDPDSCFLEMLNHFSKEEMIEGLKHYWVSNLNPVYIKILKKLCKKYL